LLDSGEVHEPRLSGMVSITDVDVSPDLKLARVYYSCFGSEEERVSTAEGFESASGFIQREVGKRLGVKFTPELIFERDDTMAYADHLEKVIKKIDEDESEE